MNTRGAMIRQARTAMALSQEAVAKAAKITQQAYSDIENDKTAQPRRSALRAIAKTLDIPEDALILNRPDVASISKEARMIAEEYDHMPPAYQAKILMTILEAKKVLR
jgi:transcriptional regulator with XRE-family HTH domain